MPHPYRRTPPNHILHVANHNNAMHMVGHHHKSVQFHLGVMVGNGLPAFPRDLPIFRQLHFIIYHLAKQVFALIRANRDEIRACLGVIVLGHAD